PGVRGASGRFLLEGDRMRITGVRGSVEGASAVALDQGSVEIDALTQAPQLRVRLHAAGPAAQMLGFVQRSPVNRYTQRVLAEASASGPAALDLQLALPLLHPQQTRINGRV